MASFKDGDGRIWVVEITVGTIRRVRSLAEVNLLEVVEGPLIEQLSSDPLLLCDVLYAVCQPQAEELGLTDEDFGEGLAGDVIDAATAALLESLVAFFPESRRRLLSKAATKYRQVEQKALALVEARLDNPRLEARILKDLERELDRQESSD